MGIWMRVRECFGFRRAGSKKSSPQKAWFDRAIAEKRQDESDFLLSAHFQSRICDFSDSIYLFETLSHTLLLRLHIAETAKNRENVGEICFSCDSWWRCSTACISVYISTYYSKSSSKRWEQRRSFFDDSFISRHFLCIPKCSVIRWTRNE